MFDRKAIPKAFEQYGMKGVEMMLERHKDPRMIGHALIYAVREGEKKLFLTLLDVAPTWARANALKDVALYRLGDDYARALMEKDPQCMLNNHEAVGGFLADQRYDLITRMLPFLHRKECARPLYRSVREPQKVPYSIHEALLQLPFDFTAPGVEKLLSDICRLGDDALFELYLQQDIPSKTWAWVVTQTHSLTQERFDRLMDGVEHAEAVAELQRQKSFVAATQSHFADKKISVFDEKYAMYLKNKLTQAVQHTHTESKPPKAIKRKI